MAEGDSGAARVDLRLLGPVELVVDGRPATLRRGRQERLLAALALRRNESVAALTLTDLLWPYDAPENPTNALQHLVAQVRRSLGPARERLQTLPGAYRLLLSDEECDLGRAVLALSACSHALDQGDLGAAREALAPALDVWRGEPLGGDLEGPLAHEADRLHEWRVRIAVSTADVALAGAASEELHRAAARLEQVCADHPTDELLWARRIAVLAALSRPAEALRAYDELRRRLSDELGVDPGADLRDLHARLLREDQAPPVARAPRGVAVPVTSLVGRASELAMLREWAASGARLVTITGPAGVGKTRLAIELVHGLRRPTVLARLDGIGAGGDVAAAVAAVVGLREVGTRELVDVLAESLAPAAVVVLDNAEHVLGAVAQLAGHVAGRRPDVLLVVTTQWPLGLPGERLLRLQPLSAGAAGDDAVPPAAQLLLDRAADVAPPLAHASAAEVTAAVEIGRLLDGLPLAIELAAAQAALLPLADVARQLRESTTLLDGGGRSGPRRHQQLSSAMRWSTGLLAPHERRLFVHCALLTGAFDAPLAAAVSGVDPDTCFRWLLDLAHRSVLHVSHDPDGVRFRLLRPLRLHALRELDRSPEAESARTRLVTALVELVEQVDEGIRGPEQLRWLRRLEAARGDVESALEVALGSGRIDSAARIVAAAGRSWDWLGRLRDADRWTAAVMRAAEGVPASDVPRLGAVLSWRAFVAVERGDVEGARALAVRGLEAAAAAGDDDGTLVSQATLALVDARAGDFARAREWAQRMLATAQSVGQPWGEAWAVNSGGFSDLALGDLAAAQQAADDSLRRFRELQDVRAQQWAAQLAAAVTAARGERARAHELAAQVRWEAEATGDLRAAANATELLATLVEDDDQSGALRSVVAELRQARTGQAAPHGPR